MSGNFKPLPRHHKHSRDLAPVSPQTNLTSEMQNGGWPIFYRENGCGSHLESHVNRNGIKLLLVRVLKVDGYCDLCPLYRAQERKFELLL